MEKSQEDELGSLERARARLYSPHQTMRPRPEVHPIEERELPHAWDAPTAVLHRGARHVRLATIFLGSAVVFFLVALGAAGYFLYVGGNSVSPDKITVSIDGPTTIAGGDTVPLSITITNKNPVALQDATIEIDFPEGTRSATNVLNNYPRYVENLGTLESGQTITRSVKAVVFGAAGQTVTLPVSLSYATPSSNAVFDKKLSYTLAISSTPLSISVDSLKETVSGAPITFTLNVRSNATVPLGNVVVAAAYPFGFTVDSSSIPMTNSSFALGTLAPGASKVITLTGRLTGQDTEQRVFHFTVGTSKSAQDQTLGVTYMTQDATIALASPFITTNLSLNGDTSGDVVIQPGAPQSVTLSYVNTLNVPVTDASITVQITGSAINYDSIRSTGGFYNSSNHTILFSKDTAPSLASIAPGASGIGTFSFSTVPSGTPSPTVTFSILVAGTRVGQSNVPQEVTSSNVQTAKVATAVVLGSRTSHLSGPLPPVPNQPTVYSIVWSAQNQGSAMADAVMTATLPSYVTYLEATSGSGIFSYDNVSHTLTWNIGDMAQGARAEGLFQISFLPSTSQSGSVVSLTSRTSFSGYDRFAGVQITAFEDPATTENKQDPGYISGDGVVQ